MPFNLLWQNSKHHRVQRFGALFVTDQGQLKSHWLRRIFISRMVRVGLSKIALWPTHLVKHCNRKCAKIKGTFGWGGCCIQFTLTVAGRPSYSRRGHR